MYALNIIMYRMTHKSMEYGTFDQYWYIASTKKSKNILKYTYIFCLTTYSCALHRRIFSFLLVESLALVGIR